MDCFLTAFRSNKASRNGASDSEGAVWGLMRRATSGSSSNSSAICVEDSSQMRQGATPCLKRQRAAVFFLGCYMCGLKVTAENEEDVANKGQIFIGGVHVQRGREQSKITKEEKEELRLRWWQERGHKRRKIGSEEWIAGESDRNVVRRLPARWKRLMRRLRAKLRRMGQVQKAPSFHYDALSYAMNFDEGCWQNCEAHARLFCTSDRSSWNGGTIVVVA